MPNNDEFYPDWYHREPPEKSYRSIFKWGYPGTFKHPNRRLYALMKETFAMTDDDFRVKRNTGEEKSPFDCPVKLSTGQLDHLRALVGAKTCSPTDYSRLRVAIRKMIYDLIRLREKRLKTCPTPWSAPATKKMCRRWCASATRKKFR